MSLSAVAPPLDVFSGSRVNTRRDVESRNAFLWCMRGSVLHFRTGSGFVREGNLVGRSPVPRAWTLPLRLNCPSFGQSFFRIPHLLARQGGADNSKRLGSARPFGFHRSRPEERRECLSVLVESAKSTPEQARLVDRASCHRAGSFWSYAGRKQGEKIRGGMKKRNLALLFGKLSRSGFSVLRLP